MVNLLQFGAVGDGKTLCTECFARAVSAAKEKGETILVEAGTYYTGTINLDGVSLHLEKGAVIKGSSNPEDYPVMPYVHNEMGPLQALIVCLGGKDVVIDGEGIIDLNGSAFYDFTKPIVPDSLVPFTEEQKKECTVERVWRPNQSIFFHGANGVTIKGITILDAPCWTLSFCRCSNVKALGLTIDTNLNIPNDDGMHFSGCNGVIVSDCQISSGDDCIAMSGITDWEFPCENIVITNCVLRSCSKAIVLGYNYSHVRNVLINNVIIRESNRGLCFMCNDQGGLVENVRVTNMIIDTKIRAGNWWGNGEAIFMMGLKHDYNIPAEQNPHRVTPVNYRNIVIENITCYSENAIGAVGTGNNYEGVVFRNILVSRKVSKNLSLKGNVFDVLPAKENIPIPDDCGVYLWKASGVTLENVCLISFEGREQKIIVE